MMKKRSRAFVLLSCGLVAAFALDIVLGAIAIPPGAIARILLGLGPGHGEGGDFRAWQTIVLLIRLPKAITALLAGGALGLCGLSMQTLFRNPLADPFVLGISSGASLGVALVVLASGAASGAALLAGLGVSGQLAIVAAAGAGAAGVLLLVLVYAQRVPSVMTLLVLGLFFGYAVSAVVSILLEWSAADRVQAYIAWTFGSFQTVTWEQMPVFGVAIAVGIAASHLSGKQLNALLLGEGYAKSMGMRVGAVRTLLLANTALLAGTVTAFCGPIAFVGVAIPHLARSLLSTSNHRTLLPAVALLGATTTLAADVVSQLPGSENVLPLNAVTALIGVPVVVWVIMRRRNLKETFAG